MTNPPPPPPPGQSAGYPPPGPGSRTSPPPQFQPPGYGPPPGGPAGYGPPPAPPKKGKSKALIALLSCVGLFVAFIVIVAVAAAVAPKDPKTSTSPASTAGAGDPSAAPPSTAAPASPGASLTTPAPIGTEVTPAKGWPLKVNSANLDAGADLAKLSSAGRYLTAEPGKQFVTVDLTTTNGTGRPASIGTGVKLTLIGPAGVAIERTYYPKPAKELDTNAQLQPGTTVSGSLVFQVPKDQVDVVVLLAEPQFTLDENEDQRFLSIR